MNEYILFVICAAVFLIQLLLCFRCRKLLLRLLPPLVPLILGGACLAMYFWSDFGNWGWLLLAVILQKTTASAAVGWLVYGLWRLAKKILLLSSKNT